MCVLVSQSHSEQQRWWLSGGERLRSGELDLQHADVCSAAGRHKFALQSASLGRMKSSRRRERRERRERQA